MNELEQATSRELIRELQRRYDACIFLAVRQHETDPDAEEIVFRRRGSHPTLVGLVTMATDQLRVTTLDDEQEEAGRET